MVTSGALYRTYRPQSLSEVRDQEHIVRVLEGAIAKKAIPHALLFCGTRGTGKTTVARIFAQAIGTHSIDLYEIDAASNRGIDDIRELKEAVHTLPFESTYKVYIIDEVHMLTKEAFDALLKTLEEPPAHVVFILAMTEEEKLLDTIISRCQVFHFRSPSRSVLATTVSEVATREGFTLSPDAADLVAVAADGSFRDALGVLQKVILASGDTIGSAEEVAAIIGAPRPAIIYSLISALHTSDRARALGAIADAVALHVDVRLFTRLILEHIRVVILLRNEPSARAALLAPFGADMQELLGKCAAEESPIHSRMLVRLLAATEQVARCPIPHLPLELAIIEITTATP